MEISTSQRVTLGTVAKSAEAVSGGWLLLSVELKDHVADFLVSLGNSQVHSGVGGVAVVVQRREATLAEVEKLFGVHFFLINYLLLFIKTPLWQSKVNQDTLLIPIIN